MDPALVAVAGALSTVAGLLYRQLIMRAEKAEKERDLYRDKWLLQVGMGDMAADEAEKRDRS